MIILALICLASTGHGRRLQTTSEQMQGGLSVEQRASETRHNLSTGSYPPLEYGSPDPLEALSIFFLSLHPSAAWQVTGSHALSGNHGCHARACSLCRAVATMGFPTAARRNRPPIDYGETAAQRNRPPTDYEENAKRLLKSRPGKGEKRYYGKQNLFDEKSAATRERKAQMFYPKNNKVGIPHPAIREGEIGQTLPLPDSNLVTDKKMQKINFLGSYTDPDDCMPADGLAEVALIGRSNVGKSSVLNLMTLGASKAVVTARPGTTQSINHYSVDNKWRIIDLPGYGYAQATDEEIKSWDRFTKDLFATRANLAGVLLLVDASIPPLDKDREYADWLIANNIPFAIIWTKCDRQKEGLPTVHENQKELRSQLMERWHRLPTMIPTSSVTKEGRKDILNFISSIIVFRRRNNREQKDKSRKDRIKELNRLKNMARPKARKR